MKRDLIKKIICCTAITTSMVTVLPLNVYATTWINDNSGNNYFYEGNNYAVGWRNIDGIVYYFDASGVMQKGWIKYGDSWYYLDNNGALKTGWINYNGEWYYSDSAGIMQIGILQIDGQTYCFGNNGAMKKGSTIINGQFYTIGSNGAIVSNTVPVPDKIFDSANNCIQQINSIDTSKIINPNASKYDNPIEDESEIGDYEEPKQKFTVTFRDSNGEELKKKTVRDGDSIKTYEPDDEDTRKFVEWNTKADGRGKSYDEDEKIKITKDLTLYAVWDEIEEPIEVSGITISGGKEVEIGKSIQLTADVKPSNATKTKVKWSVVSQSGADAGKATINSDGLLTGVALGKVTVKAEAVDDSNQSAEVTIDVVNAKTLVSSITITGGDSITTDGGTLQLGATVLPENASDNTIRWRISEGGSYATIDSSTGLLTAIANGTVKVVASAEDGSGISATKEIKIENQSVKPQSIIVSTINGSRKVSIDKTIQMKAEFASNVADQNKEVTWSAIYTSGTYTGYSAVINADNNDKSIATLIPKAIVNGQQIPAKGNIKVTAKSTVNGAIGTKTITAVQEVNGMVVKADGNIILDTGKEPASTTGNISVTTDAAVIPLEVSFSDVDGNKVDTSTATWDIDNSDIAVLDNTKGKTNKLRAKKNGNAILTIEADGQKVTINVNIINQLTKVTNIELKQTTGSAVEVPVPDSIFIGQSIDIKALVSPDNASENKVNWTVSSTNSTDVNSLVNFIDNGDNTIKITGGSKYGESASKAGMIKIEAKAKDGSGKSATKFIKIVQPVKSVTLVPDKVYVTNGGSTKKITAGQTITITGYANPSTAPQNIELSVDENNTTISGYKVISNNNNAIKIQTLNTNTGKLTVIGKPLDGYVEPGAPDSRTQSIDIEVIPQVAENGITIQPVDSSATTVIEEGSALELKATVLPDDAYKGLKWSVSNPSIATINELANGNATITAISQGQVDVIATAEDGSSVKGIIHIEVTPKPEPNPDNSSQSSENGN